MHASPSSTVREFSGALRDRPDLLEESMAFMARHIAVAKIQRRQVTPQLHIRSRIRSVAGYSLMGRTSSGAILSHVTRSTPDIAKDGRDRFHVHMNIAGESRISQFGRSTLLKPRSYTLMTASDPCIVEGRGSQTDSVVLMMPREVVERRFAAGEQQCIRPPGASASFQKLTFAALQAFGDNGWGLTPDEFLDSARALSDLVLLSLDGSPDVLSDERSVRLGNLSRVKHIIRRRLVEPDLTLAAIASEAGLSLSYIHKLFRDDPSGQGRTMYEYLKHERLRRARKLLEASSPYGMTIADISFECGFADKSYFSRLFKQVFGVSPGDMRADAAQRRFR